MMSSIIDSYMSSHADGDDGNSYASTLSYTRAAGDLQTVTTGTSAELYGIMQAQMKSCGAPSWEERANQSHSHPDRLSMFLFGTDAGGENRACFKRIKNRLTGITNVSFWAVFCFFIKHISLSEI